eukprot:6237424-Prymnesium_polylepis.1
MPENRGRAQRNPCLPGARSGRAQRGAETRCGIRIQRIHFDPRNEYKYMYSLWGTGEQTLKYTPANIIHACYIRAHWPRCDTLCARAARQRTSDG